MATDYSETIQDLKAFRDQRGWQKYHTLPELARAMMVESAEVNEYFLWHQGHDQLTDKQVEGLKLELADVLTYLYYMCDQLDVTPNDLVQQKMAINQQRHWKFDR